MDQVPLRMSHIYLDLNLDLEPLQVKKKRSGNFPRQSVKRRFIFNLTQRWPDNVISVSFKQRYINELIYASLPPEDSLCMGTENSKKSDSF